MTDQHNIENGKSNLWILLFAACTALNIVPTPLVEFRYFIVPYLLLQLNLLEPRAITNRAQQVSLTAELVDLVTFTIINAITVYIFLYRTFTYGPLGSIEETGRFMW